MNHSRFSTYFIGIILIVVGLGILFNNLNVFHFNFGNLIIPIIFVLIGIKLFDRGKQTAAIILLLIGALMLLSAFGINIGNLIGLAFSLAVIYIGYRMMRSKKRKFKIPPPSEQQWDAYSEGSVNKHEPYLREMTDQKTHSYYDKEWERTSPLNENAKRINNQQAYSFTSDHAHHDNESATFNSNKPKMKHSLIGNLYLTAPRWELTDMNIWHAIGEVKIDLSRALIHETETVLIINGWIGDIDIYVPYDLEVAISANINIGDIDMFGNKEGGFNRSISIETNNYRDAAKRVRVIISLIVGDVDIMYV